jgi:hypothetical protein
MAVSDETMNLVSKSAQHSVPGEHQDCRGGSLRAFIRFA